MSVETLPQPDTYAVLPEEVHLQLWERIGLRLQRGDTLITTRDFLTALETEYQAITGDGVSATLRDLFADAVASFNRDYPERYVAHGVQNSVTRAFQSGCFKLEWDEVMIESAGARSVARFKSRDWVRGFLKEVRVSLSLIREEDCVRSALEVVAGRQAPLSRHSPSEPLDPDLAPPVAAARRPVPEPPGEEAAEALRDGTLSQGEVDSRQAEQEEVRSRIERSELARAGERADSYVRQGYLTAEEGEAVRRLHEIDQRLERGEIDSAEATRLRNSLLTKEQRFALERKLKGAVDHAVRFLQAFESIQRVSPTLDEALRFLIFHKDILDPASGGQERARAAQELLEDRDMLRSVVEVMERKDQEIRMISVGLPPYSYVVKRNERIGNLVIEEAFMDDLRTLTAEQMSDRLHSEDPEVRVRPAADIRCLISIVSYLIKPTPWRKEVRLLRVQDTIEGFYNSSENVEEARKQAESFIHRRLRRVFRDLSNEEKEELEQRGAEMIDTIEQRIADERRQAVEALAVAAAGDKSGDDGAEEDQALTEEEVQKGATIGRVEMRIAGQMRRVPRKIMRDPDDTDRFLLALRHPETGVLEPVLRRGSKRHVQRGSDGFWRLVG